MTDLEMLGLDENYTYEDLKKVYRVKSKKLHPDYNESSIESHIAMIKLNQAYSNLLQKVKEELSINTIQEVVDESYDIYKRAIEKFQAVHPSKWKVVNQDGMFNSGAIETNNKAPMIIKTLIDNMSNAYYDFSTVVNEYRNSPWFFDSKDKMREIEKMTKRYMKILESYEKE